MTNSFDELQAKISENKATLVALGLDAPDRDPEALRRVYDQLKTAPPVALTQIIDQLANYSIFPKKIESLVRQPPGEMSMRLDAVRVDAIKLAYSLKKLLPADQAYLP
mgnify:CR=1 FL=1